MEGTGESEGPPNKSEEVLAKDNAPEPRLVERLEQGRIVETPMVGGLDHRYTRQAA